MNADSKMLGDPRFKKLGQRLGMSHFEAFGRVLPVWMMAYENRSEFMAPVDVDALAERAGFADGMAAANLAAVEPDGRLRLRGVAERIRFLVVQDHKRELAMAAKLEKLGRGSTGRPPGPSPLTSPGTDSGTVPRDVPISPDLDQSLAPDLAPDPEKNSLPRAIPQYVPGTGPMVDRVWAYQRAALDDCRKAFDASAPELPARPPHTVETAMAKCAREARDAGRDPEQLMRHRVDIAKAESFREQHTRFFKSTTLWEPERFWRAAETSLDEAARTTTRSRDAPIARPRDDDRPRSQLLTRTPKTA